MPYNLIVTPQALEGLDAVKFDFWLGKMSNPLVADRIHNWFWDIALPKIAQNPFSCGEPWDNLPVLAKAGYRRVLYNDYYIAVLYRIYSNDDVVVDYVYDQRQKKVSRKGRLLK